MAVDVGDVSVRASCGEYVERTFRQVAETKGLEFDDRRWTMRCRATHPDRRQAAPAGAQEPALQRLQVHRAGQRRARPCGAPPAAGTPSTSISTRPAPWWPSASPTPASASRRRSRRSSSRRSSRPTAPPAASTAAPAWASRSAARSPACWAARSGSRARRARAARSRSTCRASYPAQWRRRQIARRKTPAPGAAPRRRRRPPRPAPRRPRG